MGCQSINDTWGSQVDNYLGPRVLVYAGVAGLSVPNCELFGGMSEFEESRLMEGYTVFQVPGKAYG